MIGQTEFRQALLDAEQPVPSGLLDGYGAAAGRRFSVYRNNVAVSLTEALRVAFPVLCKLLGNENFDRLAGIFLRAHPPRSPMMMHYGQDLPAFLETFEPLQQIGYLPDVARLENAIRLSYHAKDAEPVDTAVIASLPPEQLTGARVRFAPAIQMVRSPWPLYDIWRFNSEDGAPKPEARAQSVLVTRAEYDPMPHPLTPPEAICLAALMEGQSFSQAIAAAEAEAKDFDLSPLLSRLIAQNGITELNV